MIEQQRSASGNVLVVEDDVQVADAVADLLRRHGYDVDIATTGRAVEHRLIGVDLMLLDLNLPDLDGTEVCRRARAVSDVGIIMVTARGGELDRVTGLRSGADDYLVKPFSGMELLARVEAVLRRRRPPDPGAAPVIAVEQPRQVRTLGRVEIDLTAHRVRVDGQEVLLSRKEYDVLRVLAERPGALVRRDELIARVWGEPWAGPTRTLDVHVSALRQKLDDAAIVETVRGVGYRLRA